MITAVDTSVLLDLLLDDPTFGDRSAEALRRARREGALIACDVVWAEVVAAFVDGSAASDAMNNVGVRFSSSSEHASTAAGGAWRAYRRSGERRERLVADFIIGAHALTVADRLLTRDRGFYRAYFKELRILNPMS